MKDVFDLEDELTERLLHSLREGAFVGRQPRDRLSSRALQECHHALHELAHIRLEPAVAALRNALAESPEFAPALARLSQCLVYMRCGWGPQAGLEQAPGAMSLADRSVRQADGRPRTRRRRVCA